MAGGRRIGTRNPIRAPGVTASPVGASLGAPREPRGRVQVNADPVSASGARQRIPGRNTWPRFVAKGAKYRNRRLRRSRKGGTSPFRYRDKGALATNGRGAAVVEVGKVRLSGIVPVARLTIHMFYLIVFHNRFLVLAEMGRTSAQRARRAADSQWGGAAARGGLRITWTGPEPGRGRSADKSSAEYSGAAEIL